MQVWLDALDALFFVILSVIYSVIKGLIWGNIYGMNHAVTGHQRQGFPMLPDLKHCGSTNSTESAIFICLYYYSSSYGYYLFNAEVPISGRKNVEANLVIHTFPFSLGLPASSSSSLSRLLLFPFFQLYNSEVQLTSSFSSAHIQTCPLFVSTYTHATPCLWGFCLVYMTFLSPCLSQV